MLDCSHCAFCTVCNMLSDNWLDEDIENCFIKFLFNMLKFYFIFVDQLQQTLI